MWFTARFCVHPHPANHFYYCYGGILHNSDILSTDNPALYHNYSVYIFLTPFDPYCHLHPRFILRQHRTIKAAVLCRNFVLWLCCSFTVIHQVLPQNCASSVRKIYSQITLVQLCGIALKYHTLRIACNLFKISSHILFKKALLTDWQKYGFAIYS